MFPLSVTVLVNVILSPTLAILNPVLAPRTTSSVLPIESVSLIFSSLVLSPLAADIP